MRIVGCYAQTELGHGSNVAGLETTATLDLDTDEFVIHCPNIEATKYWPGDMGMSANSAVVYANLMIKNKSFGVQPFFVPLRDFETHKNLPGITSGDIGPKIGFESKENSWLILEKVRVPRENMLMKYAKVDREGNFRIEGDLRVLYSIMMQTRVFISAMASHDLASCLTIAVRYATVRRQFATLPDKLKSERRLIDYQTHQFKLLPPLAMAYANNFAIAYMKKEIATLMESIKAKDFHSLPLLHHLTSTFKSVLTWDSLLHCEHIRQSCGGAGFLRSAGFHNILQNNYANPTHEGENTVMAHQGAKFIYNQLHAALNHSQVHPIFDYLLKYEQNKKTVSSLKTKTDFLNPDNLLACLGLNAGIHVFSLGQKMTSSKASPLEKENDLFGQEQVRMVINHASYIIFKLFKDGIELQNFSQNTKNQLYSLLVLYGHGCLKKDGIFLFDGGYLK